jgi:hypothetical protein
MAVEESALGRFGQVLYWAGCGFAALFFCFAVLGVLDATAVGKTPSALSVLLIVASGLSWVVGRACLYVLAGR